MTPCVSRCLHSSTMGLCPRLPLLLLSFSTLLVQEVTASEFKICAYNVEKFDSAKASDSRALHTLKKIVSRCDICLLQNVVDAAAVTTLLVSLNRYDNYSYQSVSSRSLGNSPSDMQQYVFIYRVENVNVTGQHQYEQKKSFVRPPFAVQFQSKNIAVQRFILVPLHAEPSQAVQEIDRLYDVFKEVSNKWNNTNVMFLGDFHASCAYVTRADKKNIRLFKSSFYWLIRDKVDTTISPDTNCAFDRIVVHGKPFLKAISPLSGQVFNYVKEFKLPTSKALEMSQNFPLEVTLKSSALLLQATPLLMLISVLAIVQSFLSAL
ncbi:Deoxyribonuclease-1-like 2 [Liparis tanakae]|uniref:Deoxyribonuclease-1-like 1 n=1 Tax=Liparis tanakae TaxID=230148 RepID=A0A4Z2F9K8_9TELE|nr:Deoxyribonuclease-1-like 2 [Liparis tanakae]